MNLPAVLYALRWLVRDTIRQAVHSGLFAVMLLVTGLCVLLCLSVRIDPDVEATEFLPRPRPISPPKVVAVVAGPRFIAAALVWEDRRFDPDLLASRYGVATIGGDMSIGFGAIQVPKTRSRANHVQFLQLLLAGWVADTAGLLLALIWTAGFLPTFLEPSAASVLLAKPVPRWCLLVGKYLGVLAFVLFQAVLFVGGTWAALGFATGVWIPTYLLSIPLLLLHFAIFFSFSVLLAVLTRSTAACVIGSILFWLLCWAINFGRHMVLLTPEMRDLSGLTRFLVEAGYWIMPKPADLGVLLFNALQAENFFGAALQTRALIAMNAFHPDLAILTSLLFTAGILAVAAYQFATTDY